MSCGIEDTITTHQVDRMKDAFVSGPWGDTGLSDAWRSEGGYDSGESLARCYGAVEL